MGSPTSQGLTEEVSAKAQTADKTVMVNQHGRKNQKAELGHQRLDQLLPHRKNETEYDAYRWTSAYKNADRHLETVENKTEEILEPKETRCTGMDG